MLVNRTTVISKPTLRNSRGSWTKNDTENRNLFANHLKNVFTPNVTTDIAELPLVVARAAIPLRFEFREIEKFICDLNDKKAPGIDKISNKMLLELPRLAVAIRVQKKT